MNLSGGGAHERSAAFWYDRRDVRTAVKVREEPR